MELGKLTAIFDADTRKFDAGLRGVQTKIGGVTKDLGKATAGTSQFTNSLSPATSGLSGLASSLSVVAGGTVVAAAAIGSAGAAIYKLAVFSQQLGGEIFDLSGKINFTAETLSSLKVAAELSGGSLASLSTSLGIFDRNIEEAREGGNEMSRVFKALKIDTEDNEKALRQAFTALVQLKGGSQQTALAMKLFGRSGKEVLGIIKESGGDVDAYTEKLREMGLVITSSGAKKADEFGDKLTMLQLKLEAVGRQIGQELVPTVERAADEISGWLNRNQGEIAKTATEVGSLVRQIYDLAQQIRSLSPLTLQINVVRNFVEGMSIPMGQNFFDKEKTMNAPAQLPEGLPTLSVFQRRQQGPTTFSPFANPRGAGPARIDIPGAPKGGGGGGAKAQKDVLEALKNEVISLNTEFRKLDVELFNSANMSALLAQKQELLSKVMSQLSLKAQMEVSEIRDVDEALDSAIGKLPKKSQAAAQSLRELALAKFKDNEQTRIAGELTKATEQLTKQWKQELDNTRSGVEDYEIAIQSLEAEYRKYNKTLSDGQKEELRSAAVQKKHWELFWELIGNANSRLEIHARLLGTIDTLNDSVVKSLTGPGTAEGNLAQFLEIEPPDLSDASKEILRIRESMRELATDLTGIFSDSIRTGFESGTKAGLASLAQGLLRIVEDIFLKKLAAGLGELLGGLGTGGSGGGGGGIVGQILRDLGGFTPSVTGTATTPVVEPRDLENQTRTLIGSTTQQTQALSNQIQLTGQQIIQGLTPVQQGFWQGLLGAAIGGAVSGLASGLTSRLGGDEEDNEGPVGARPRTPPVMRYRAGGGPVEAGQSYMVGETGKELFVPQSAGNIYNQAQMAKMGGTVVNNYNTINLPAPRSSSHVTPKSQRQQAEILASILASQMR